MKDDIDNPRHPDEDEPKPAELGEMDDDAMLAMALSAHDVEADELDDVDDPAGQSQEDDDRDAGKALSDDDDKPSSKKTTAPKADDASAQSGEQDAAAQAKGGTASDGAADWTQGLPEEARNGVAELQKEIKQLQNQKNATAGKLAPTQRRVAELERQITELKQATTATQRQQPPTEKDAAEETAKWKQYRDEFPEEAELFDERLKAERRTFQESAAHQEARIARLEARLSERDQDDAQTRYQDERGRLKEEFGHSDIEQIFAEDSDWDEWLAGQPQEFRQMADHLDAKVYDRLLNIYKLDHGIALPSLQSEAGGSSTDTPAEDPNADTEAQRIQARRKRARSNVSPGPASTRPASTQAGGRVGADLDALDNPDDIAGALLDSDEFADLRKELGG